MWYKLCLFASIIALISSCQQSSQNPKTENYSDLNSAKSDNANARADSLEDLADKMRDEAMPDESNSIAVAIDDWSADKNLNTVRCITLTNTSSRKVVGVKLVYVLPMGKSIENRDLGKFKVQLNASNKVALKIPAKKFGVSDNIIERDATTRLMFPDDKVVASVIYFENGEVEVHDFPIGFQHKE